MLKIPEELVDRIVWETQKNEEAAPPLIKKIMPLDEACPDCGRIVEDRIVHIKLSQSPCEHWRQQCQSCRNYKNPQTGKFDIKYDRAQAFFRSYFGVSAK